VVFGVSMSAEFDINLNLIRTFGTYLFVCKPKSSAYLRVALGLYINERSALKAVPCFAPCHAEAALTGYSTKRNISPEKTMTLLPMMNHSVFPSIFMATSTVAAALPTQTSTPPSGKDHNSSTYFCVRLTATVEKPRRTLYDSTVGIVQVP
jgi:hypothetical protein